MQIRDFRDRLRQRVSHDSLVRSRRLATRARLPIVPSHEFHPRGTHPSLQRQRRGHAHARRRRRRRRALLAVVVVVFPGRRHSSEVHARGSMFHRKRSDGGFGRLSNLSMRRERVAQPRRELFFFGFLRYHRTIACCLRSSSSFSSSPKNQPTNERTNDDDALKERRRTKANTFSSSSMPFSLLLFGALLLVVVLSSSSSSSWAKKSQKDYSTSSKKSTKDTHTFETLNTVSQTGFSFSFFLFFFECWSVLFSPFFLCVCFVKNLASSSSSSSSSSSHTQTLLFSPPQKTLSTHLLPGWW